MAQGQVSQTQSVAAHDIMAPTDHEIHQLKQYERIVQFRDAVLSGKHPRFKVPAHLVGKLGLPTPPAPLIPPGAAEASSNLQRPATLGSSHIAASSAGATPRPFASGNTEIDPILLEKSDDLIRAEIQLQRQRLERALREQIEQRRASMKSSLQGAEPIADLDLSDVLSRALSLVQPAAPQPANASLQTNSLAASDSFDENTFYSSRHDTPDTHHSEPGHNVPDDVRTLQNVNTEPTFSPPVQEKDAGGSREAVANPSLQAYPRDREQEDRTVPAAAFPSLPLQPAAESQQMPPHHGLVSGENTFRDDIYGDEISGSHDAGSGAMVSSSQESGGNSRPEKLGNGGTVRYGDYAIPGLNSQLLSQDAPVVRSHDLSPIAPQPAHVSALAVTMGPQGSGSQPAVPPGAPAQVTALRGDPAAPISPESSPQGGPGSSKKKSKRKKRKADRQGPEAAPSPLIKPEPRSPSPLTAPPLARPYKRQRQNQRQANELNYAEPRFDQDPGNGHHERYIARPYREERGPVVYERQDNLYPQPESGHSVDGPSRYEREYVEERRTYGGDQFVRRRPSPGAYSVQYASTEVQPARSVSQVTVDRPYREPPRIYHDEHHFARMSVREGGDRAKSRSPIIRERHPEVMGPPKPPSSVVMDAFGREYMEPPRPPLGRQSAAPMMRSGEPDILFERPPLRAASTRPGMATYDEDTVVYRRASPLGASRRVLTQPEQEPPDHRSYRQREYSTRPMPPPSADFIQIRGSGPERRPTEDGFIQIRGSGPDRRPTEDGFIQIRGSGPERRPAEDGFIQIRGSGPERRPAEDGFIQIRGSGPDRRPAEDGFIQIRGSGPDRRPTEDGFIQFRGNAPERRPPEDSGLEFVSRSASVRPAEHVRYEVPREYGRVQSAMPEAPVREYVSGAYPESRREVVQPMALPPREFSVRPVEGHVVRREYSTRPVERYYERPGQEIAFIERPRGATQEIVYVDDVRREIYR